MMKRLITLSFLVFLSGCGSGDGWYESKDWGKWAKSDGGRWYGDGSNEEEDSWWCEFFNTCEEEKSVACSQYGNCEDDEDKSVSCSVYGNCYKDDDGDADADDEKKSVSCGFYGNCPE